MNEMKINNVSSFNVGSIIVKHVPNIVVLGVYNANLDMKLVKPNSVKQLGVRWKTVRVVLCIVKIVV